MTQYTDSTPAPAPDMTPGIPEFIGPPRFVPAHVKTLTPKTPATAQRPPQTPTVKAPAVDADPFDRTATAELLNAADADAYALAYAIGCSYSEGSAGGNSWLYETVRYSDSADAVSALVRSAPDREHLFRVGYDVCAGFYCEPYNRPADAHRLPQTQNPNPADGTAPWNYPELSVRATRRFLFSRSRYLLADGALLSVRPHGNAYVYAVVWSDMLAAVDCAERAIPDGTRALCELMAHAIDTADTLDADAVTAYAERLCGELMTHGPTVADAVGVLYPVCLDTVALLHSEPTAPGPRPL